MTTYDGDCTVELVDGKLTVRRADPHIRISGEVLNAEHHPDFVVEGDTVTIHAVNTIVAYRLVNPPPYSSDGMHNADRIGDAAVL